MDVGQLVGISQKNEKKLSSKMGRDSDFSRDSHLNCLKEGEKKTNIVLPVHL